MDRDWTVSFSIRFRNGTCIIILDKKYNVANSSCHFGSYDSIWTGPYTAIWPSVPWTICYMFNSTNTVVHFDGENSNLCLHLRTIDCSIFHLAKFKQTITHQHVLLRWDETAVMIIVCFRIAYLLLVDHFHLI